MVQRDDPASGNDGFTFGLGVFDLRQSQSFQDRFNKRKDPSSADRLQLLQTVHGVSDPTHYPFCESLLKLGLESAAANLEFKVGNGSYGNRTILGWYSSSYAVFQKKPSKLSGRNGNLGGDSGFDRGDRDFDRAEPYQEKVKKAHTCHHGQTFDGSTGCSCEWNDVLE